MQTGKKIIQRPLTSEEKKKYGDEIEFMWDGKLPELDEEVLVYTSESEEVYTDIWVDFNDGIGFENTFSNVIYWMSFPKPPEIVETIFQRRTTGAKAGHIYQYIFPHERGYEPPVEISKHYVTRRFDLKQPVQILSTKTTTMTKTLSNGYPTKNFIVRKYLELILKEIENTIEYQTMAGLTEEQYSFVNWAKGIVETVDKYIHRFDKLYYTEEELKELVNLSHESIETVYLIEFYGSDQDNSNRLVKAERLKKILADGSLLGQKEEIELKQTSKGLEVKDTDIERLERTYQGQGLFINAVPLEY